jgi:hypothetical protein
MRNSDPIADYYSFVGATKTSQISPVIGETSERHLIAFDVDPKNTADWLAHSRRCVQRTGEKLLLDYATDVGNDDEKTSMQRLHCIESWKITGVIRDQHETSVLRGDAAPSRPSRGCRRGTACGIWGAAWSPRCPTGPVTGRDPPPHQALGILFG